MSEAELIIEHEDGYAVLILNRPLCSGDGEGVQENGQ